MIASPTWAQQNENDDQVILVQYNTVSDAADRISIASQLPTLTQQIAAAACAVTSGVDVAEAKNILSQATGEFDRYINALRKGDEDLHIIGPETRRLTLAELDSIQAEWAITHDAIDAITSDNTDINNAHVIDDHNMPLLDLTTLLASNIANQYATLMKSQQVT